MKPSSKIKKDNSNNNNRKPDITGETSIPDNNDIASGPASLLQIEWECMEYDDKEINDKSFREELRRL